LLVGKLERISSLRARLDSAFRGFDDIGGISGVLQQSDGVPRLGRTDQQLVIKGYSAFPYFLLEMIVDKAGTGKLCDFYIMGRREYAGL
jgi:hypothetical protein